MKFVLIALPNDSLGGAELYLKNLALFYSDKGHFVKVFFLKKHNYNGWKEFKHHENVELIYTRSSSEFAGVLKFLLNIYKYRSIKFNYIFTSHVHLTGILGFLIKLGFVKKERFVGRESTSIFKRFSGFKLLIFKIQYYLGYSALDLLICQTKYMQNQLINSLPKLSSKIKITVLPNPVNFEDIDVSSEIEYSNFIVAAGRLINEKGFDILIDSFSQLNKQYPELKLIILGEGRLRDILQDKINKLNLKNKVFLLGFVENVYPFFKKAKVCVVSSRVEGFPNVLLQMMSQNTNVVSTNCAGDIDKIDGIYLTKTNNSSLLKDKIIECIHTDNSKNRELFDNELADRNISTFVQKIHNILNAQT